MPALGLYFNGINSSESFQDLDFYLYGNVAALKKYGDDLPPNSSVPDMLIRLARESDVHKTSRGGPKGMGERIPLWKGIREFSLEQLVKNGVVPALGNAIRQEDMLTSHGVESFIRSLRSRAKGELSVVFGGHGGGPRIVIARVGIELERTTKMPRRGGGRGDGEATVQTGVPPTFLTASGVCAGLARAGIGPADRLGMIGLDACLDATMELAVEFSPYAKVLCASEMTIPLMGWNYASWPAALFTDDELTSRCAAIVQNYRDTYAACGGPPAAHSLSAIDLEQMAHVTKSMRKLSSFVINDAHARSRLLDARRAVPGLPYSNETTVDAMSLFKAFAEKSADPRARQLAGDAVESIRNAVGGRAWADSVAQSTGSATGLSIGFPASFADVDDSFRQFYFYSADELAKFKTETGWHAAVASCFGAKIPLAGT